MKRFHSESTADVLELGRIYIWAASELGVKHPFGVSELDKHVYSAGPGGRLVFHSSPPPQMVAFAYIALALRAFTPKCFGSSLEIPVSPSDVYLLRRTLLNGQTYEQAQEAIRIEQERREAAARKRERWKRW